MSSLSDESSLADKSSLSDESSLADEWPLMPDGSIAPELLAGEVDFYCAFCGYNLRGLAGDPKRCPECGTKNPIRNLIVPAEAITLHLRQLESAPTRCFAAVLSLGVGVFVLGLAMSTPRPAAFACLIVPLLTYGVAGWPIGAYSFARSCQFQFGWKAALAKFHGYALILFIAVYAVLGGLLFMTCAVTRSAQENVAAETAFSIVAIVLAWLAGAWAMIRIAGWSYGKAKEDFPQLQRKVAVELARKAMQRGLARQMKAAWWR